MNKKMHRFFGKENIKHSGFYDNKVMLRFEFWIVDDNGSKFIAAYMDHSATKRQPSKGYWQQTVLEAYEKGQFQGPR